MSLDALAVQIISPGLLLTIQDQGRTGHEAYGLPRSGAFDPFFSAVANRLVGNSRSAAVLEFAVIGPRLKFEEPCAVAVTGSGCFFHLDGNPVSGFSAFHASPQSVLEFQSMKGWFGYIAISGGVEEAFALGSRSAYLPGRIGRRLQAGDTIKIHPQGGNSFCRIDEELIAPLKRIPLLSSLHTDLFSEAEKKKITEHEYQVTSQSNRMGMRLRGDAIDAQVLRRSCPVVNGTLQIPQAGQPIILGPDGPTTGGYAQLGVIARVAWTTLAATPPGKLIAFEWTTRETAIASWNEREAIFNNRHAWQKVD